PGAWPNQRNSPFRQDRARRLILPERGPPGPLMESSMTKSINHLATADGLFFGKGGLDQRRTARLVDEALAGCDDGELFLEYVQSESLTFDDAKLKSASSDTPH